MLETLNPHQGRLAELKHFCGAYVLKHPSTGKMYIGSSINMYGRYFNHQGALRANRHKNPNLQAAFNACDKLDFVFYKTDDREEAFKLEQALIDYYMPQGVLFNVGEDVHAPNLGREFSEETKEKISKVRTGTKASEETKAKLSKMRKGIKKSLDHRLKIAEVHKAKPLTAEKLQHCKDLGVKNRIPVMVDGVRYPSVTHCANALGLKRSVVQYRLNNPNRPTWCYVNTNEE